MIAAKGLPQPLPEDSLPLRSAEPNLSQHEMQADEEASSGFTDENDEKRTS